MHHWMYAPLSLCASIRSLLACCNLFVVSVALLGFNSLFFVVGEWRLQLLLSSFGCNLFVVDLAVFWFSLAVIAAVCVCVWCLACCCWVCSERARQRVGRKCSAGPRGDINIKQPITEQPHSTIAQGNRLKYNRSRAIRASKRRERRAGCWKSETETAFVLVVFG